MSKIPQFHIMAKPIGPICNISCKYCFYLEKENLYPDKKGKTNWSMTDEVLESFIRQKLEASDLQTEYFAWQGGEPTLLGIGFFKKVIELQKKYAAGREIENAFQTNGILLNDEWCEFFADNNFLVGISIDGPRDLHNKYRIDKGGNPTFDKVMSGLEFLRKHNVQFNTLTAVHLYNSKYPLEVYNFLKEIGSRFIQFIPIVVRDNEKKCADEVSVGPEQYGEFLIGVFDNWVRKDVGKVFVQIFDVSLEGWAGFPISLCLFDKTCGRALALEHNGDLYSCDHFVYQQNKLGNILKNSLSSMVNSDRQKIFGEDKLNKIPSCCLQCDVRFICNGECPKNRFLTMPEGEAGLNYLCKGYKMFFEHISPYMKFMANEIHNNRAPANVINWANEKDKGFPFLNVGRNEPCPCGSGKKYKSCCGVRD